MWQCAARKAALRVLLTSVLCPAAWGQTIVVFGDSLSDAGVQSNGGGYAKWLQFVMRTEEVYPQPPYSGGRYSNGPVWVEVAAKHLGSPLIDWAAGGATTGAVIGQAGSLPKGFASLTSDTLVQSPTLFQQLDQYYLTTNNTADSSAVYILFFGSNDYLSIASQGTNVTAPGVISNIEDAMDNLYNRGARRFVLVALPSVLELPASAQAINNLVAAFTDHNELIADIPDSFPQSHGGALVSIFNWATITGQIILNAASYGFKNASLPCYPTPNAGRGPQTSGVEPCSDRDQHLLWDNLHPTAAAHALIGQAFATQFAPLFGKAPSPSPDGAAKLVSVG